MQELLKKCINTIKDEHQDWVEHIKKAEEGDGGVDLNLSGNYAQRVNDLVDAFQEYNKRHKKRGLF